MEPGAKITVTAEPVRLRRAMVDTATRERLTAEHGPLVRRLCARYRYAGVPMEDLVQVGCVGLSKAIDKFDPSRGTRLLSFAVPVILGEIKNYFRDHGWAVKIPRKLQRQKVVVERAVECQSQVRGRSPTVQEIASEAGLSTDEVYETLAVGKYGRPLSLELEYEHNGSDGVSTVLDYLGTEDAQLEQLADRVDLSRTLGCLKQREKTIIRLKFYSGLSQAEIAVRLGISQMHVSRLQRHALEKMRTKLGGELAWR